MRIATPTFVVGPLTTLVSLATAAPAAMPAADAATDLDPCTACLRGGGADCTKYCPAPPSSYNTRV